MVWAILNNTQNIALKELIEGQKSDRIVAIVGGAMAEDSLRRALESRMRKDDDMNKKLFKIGGPLGNFGPKIDVAFQLYMFDKPLRNAMYGISEIRNNFAHQMDMKFSSQAKGMKDAIAKLQLHEGKTHYPSPNGDGNSEFKIKPMSQTRDIFFVNLQFVLIYLMSDTHKHLPYSNTPNNIKGSPPEASLAVPVP